MSTGLSPQYHKEFTLEGLSPEEKIVVVSESVKALDWHISHITLQGLIAYTGHRPGKGQEIKIEIEGDTIKAKSESLESAFTDWGRNRKNIESLDDFLLVLKTAYTTQQLAEKFEALSTGFSDAVMPSETEMPGDIENHKSKLDEVLDFIKPRRGYIVTPVLLYINVLVFILMAISGVEVFEPSNAGLMIWGANYGPLTAYGDWWRLITSCFVHIGIFHLLFNMFALVFIGLLLEPYLGTIRFTLAYLLSGVLSSLTSALWHMDLISAGASGAIFGLYGVFLAMLTTNVIEEKVRKALLSSIAVFIGYNLFSGLKGENIDNAAHIGGLLAGILIGYAYYPSLKQTTAPLLKYLSVCGLLILTPAAVITAFKMAPSNDFAKFDQAMVHFQKLEEETLNILDITEHTSLWEMQEQMSVGIANWDKGVQELSKLRGLDLSIEARAQYELLIQYCEVRGKSYRLLARQIDCPIPYFEDSIKIYMAQIDSLLQKTKE